MNNLYPTPPERVTEFLIKLYDEKQAIVIKLVPCKVTSFITIEEMYGMTVEKFIHIANEVS